jgi:hypothetical protein
MKPYRDMSDEELKQACSSILASIEMTPEECTHEGIANSWGKIISDKKVKSECDALGAKGYGDWVQVCKRICNP